MTKFLTQFPFAGTFLWMILSAVYCWSQSPLILSILAAGCGALMGNMLAYLGRELKLSVWKVWAVGAVLMLLSSWLAGLGRWLTLPSSLLGGATVYSLSDALFWGLESLLLVGLLRWTSTVKPALMSLEILLSGAIVVDLFEAHRNGFLNRPYAIVDPLWARGIDPLPVFLALGTLVAILMLALGATHSRKRGRWIDVAGLVLLVGLFFLFAPTERLKDLPRPETSQGQDSEQKDPGGGDSGGDQGGSSGGQSSSGGQNQQDQSSSGGQNQQDQSSSGGQNQQDQGGSSGGQPQQDQGSSSGGQPQQDQGSSGGQNQQDQGGSSGGQPQQDQGSSGGQPQQDQGSSGAQPQQDQGGTSGGQDQRDSAGGQGGNSEELTFNDAGGGAADNPPIAVVIFRDDYEPDTGMYYFRQGAFSLYNGKKLVADTSGKYDRDLATDFPGKEPVKADTPFLDKKLYRELETRVALLTDHNKPFGLANPYEWTSVANPDPKRFQKAYEVKSLVLDKPLKEVLGRQSGDPKWDQETWKHYTAAPEDPRYQKLLEEILAEYPDAPTEDPLVRAILVKLWLEREGIYSLASKHEGAEDPTADFLFGDRTGYCVFFAHAACYLYRTAGMPARTGSGYAVEASNRGTGSALLIPAKTAHSWPEVYIYGMGWVILDIAPQRSIDPPPPPSDQSLQQMLGEMARQDPGEEPSDPVEKKVDLQQMLRNLLASLLHSIPYLLGLLVLAAYAWKLYRRFLPYFCSNQKLPDAVFRSSLDALADAGAVRGKGEPREVFARRCQPLAPSFLELTQAHLRHALGDPAHQPEFPWKNTFNDVRGELQQHAPTKRVLLGMLNPISWMKVH